MSLGPLAGRNTEHTLPSKAVLIVTGRAFTTCLWFDTNAEAAANFYTSIFSDMISGPDPQQAKRATEAMLSMTKFDIAALQKAYAAE